MTNQAAQNVKPVKFLVDMDPELDAWVESLKAATGMTKQEITARALRQYRENINNLKQASKAQVAA